MATANPMESVAGSFPGAGADALPSSVAYSACGFAVAGVGSEGVGVIVVVVVVAARELVLELLTAAVESGLDIL